MARSTIAGILKTEGIPPQSPAADDVAHVPPRALAHARRGVIVEGDISGSGDACRCRVPCCEGAVRQRLQRSSTEAREGGAPLSWPAGSETPRHRGVGTLLRIAALSTGTIVIGFVISNLWWVDGSMPLAARGQIGDNRCADGHAHASAELRNLSDRDCVNRCVLMGAHYVFVSQGVVYPIRNQDFQDLTRFAGQDVQLEGELRQNLLTVVRVRPLTVSRSNDSVVFRKVRVS